MSRSNRKPIARYYDKAGRGEPVVLLCGPIGFATKQEARDEADKIRRRNPGFHFHVIYCPAAHTHHGAAAGKPYHYIPMSEVDARAAAKERKNRQRNRHLGHKPAEPRPAPLPPPVQLDQRRRKPRPAAGRRTSTRKAA